jgi:hypothetical protein
MSASEPTDETSKAKFIDIESESCSVARYKSERYLEFGSDGVRCRGGMILVQAVLRNTGTCRSNVKGDVQVAKITRARVPMWNTGAEQPVVALSPSNIGGAKGLRYSVGVAGQPEIGRSL